MPLAAESVISQETLRRNPPNEESWSELQADCWVWISCYRSDCKLRVVPNLKLVWTAVSSGSEKSAFVFTFYLFSSKTLEKNYMTKLAHFLLHLISPKCLLLSSTVSSVLLWICFPAAWLWGAPHWRYLCWLCGLLLLHPTVVCSMKKTCTCGAV